MTNRLDNPIKMLKLGILTQVISPAHAAGILGHILAQEKSGRSSLGWRWIMRVFESACALDRSLRGDRFFVV